MMMLTLMMGDNDVDVSIGCNNGYNSDGYNDVNDGC